MVNFNGLYNKEFYGDNLVQGNYFSEKKIHFRVIENGTILPHKQIPGVDGVGFGGIIDSQGNFVSESFLNPAKDVAYTPYEEIQNSPATVIYLGMFVQIWGHSLTDNLKRIWFLKSETYKNYFKNCPIVYNRMWAGIIPTFARMLQILEIDLEHLYMIDRPTKFQNIIIPDESITYTPDAGGGGLKIFFTLKNMNRQ